MRKELARLALLQMAFILYCVLGIGVLLRFRVNYPAPPGLFATQVRDYGLLLLLLPAAWSIWGFRETSRETADTRTDITLLLSGIGLAGILAIVAFFATMSALNPPPLIMGLPSSSSSASHNR